MRKVEVIPYCEDWAVAYQREAEQLRHIFGKKLIAIHHIGSTSVPGLAAKPIIDIMPVVEEIGLLDASCIASMAAYGYEAKGENGISGRSYFIKGGSSRTHHVHVYGAASPEIERHLAFRDYLIAHPDWATSYGRLKQELAALHPWDIAAYINGKEALALEIDRLAIAWHKRQSYNHLL